MRPRIYPPGLQAEKARIAARDRYYTRHIRPQTCEVCGANKAECHHLDYANPERRMWLCRKHHQQMHRTKERRGRGRPPRGNERITFKLSPKLIREIQITWRSLDCGKSELVEKALRQYLHLPVIGRPPTGKVLAGFKLSPEHLATIEKLAKKDSITKSEVVENAIEALARFKRRKATCSSIPEFSLTSKRAVR